MQYKLLKALFYLFSLLPWRIICTISSLCAFLIHKVFAYRLKVVRQNLKLAFPELSRKRLLEIEKSFYKHFTDIWLEALKISSSSSEELKKKAYLPEKNLLKEYTSNGQSVFIVMGHTGNWELIDASLNSAIRGQLQALYQPIKNEAVNKIIKEYRTKFGTRVIERKKSIRTLLQQKGKETTATVFLTDQTPFELPKASWTQFFGIETPFFNGFAQLAQRLNVPVIYLYVAKESRGKYSIHFKLLSANPKEDGTDKLIERFATELESNIRKQPFNWLWTHRRWKRARLGQDIKSFSK